MENGSNVSDMLDDKINIMHSDRPETKDMLMKEEDMDIQNISTQELIPFEEDEDIHDFITELFNENNTLPKCELDQWLEDYLEEMQVQQQEEGEQKEQSQQLSDENNISLLDMCQYSDISSAEDENSPSLGQCIENKDENYDDHGDNFYNSCNCIFCSRSTIYGEQGGNIGTEPVTIQYGGGLPPMYGDEQQQQQDYENEEEEEEEEEEEVLGDDDLI